jgi:hypothetical protein
MELHSIAVHAMAIDSWILVLGSILSFRIARDPDPRSDERDSAFGARATRIAYIVLKVQLVVAILVLGYGAEFKLPEASHPLIAHALIVILMLASVSRCAVQLALYHRDQPGPT